MIGQTLDKLTSGLGVDREESARKLSHLIGSSPRFMRQFTEAIMLVLVPKLQHNDTNPAVIVCILTAIGDLAQVSNGTCVVLRLASLFVLINSIIV